MFKRLQMQACFCVYIQYIKLHDHDKKMPTKYVAVLTPTSFPGSFLYAKTRGKTLVAAGHVID